MKAHTWRMIRGWMALLLSAGFVLGLDRVSKWLILHSLIPGQFVTPIPALGEVFNLTLSFNTGAAFGLLPQAGDLFLVIGCALTVGILVFYRRIPPGYWPERIALGLLLGGALGNAVDRLQYGSVVDWVHLRIPGVISNVSNFADHAIVVGMLILFLRTWNSAPPPSSGPTADRTPDPEP